MNWGKIAVIGALLAAAGIGGYFVYTASSGPSDAERAHARTLFTAGKAALEAGDHDVALEALNESIRLDVQNDALRARSQIHMARGDFDSALHDLDLVISRRGGLAENFGARCWLRARGENLNGARADCDRAIELDPSLASAFGTRGLVALRQERYDEAWADFNAALDVGRQDEWVAWRVFGRGLAAWKRGDETEGRQDIELALRSNPTVAAEYAQFNVGGDVIGHFENAAYEAATNPRTLLALRQYLLVYPQGAHVTEARTHIDEIHAWIAEEQAAGQRTLPGFSLREGRGEGPASDSYGAIGISRSSWRVAFVTDHDKANQAEDAAAALCNANGAADCEAFAFRNVCAALAISPVDRVRGMSWAHSQDDAVRGSIDHCRQRGGRSCAPIHSVCTPADPTLPSPSAAP